MRLLSIEMAGYKRLMGDTLAIFKMDLTQKIQLILGTNGSGKSSLIAELTPLPANGEHFHKGGFKIITIHHRGHRYVLTNKFETKKGWHSFMKDDEELNLSHLQTTQYELCQQEFNYNDNTRKLLQGKLKFSQMLPKARREWMTMLSDVDFDYALMIYDRLRKEQSAANGFLKVQRGRLVVEQQKIITADEQKRLISETEALHKELSELLAIRKPIEQSAASYREQQQAGLAQLDQLSTKLLQTRYAAPLSAYGSPTPRRNEWGELEAPHFTSLEQIDIYLRILSDEMIAEQALMNQAVKDHEKIQQTLKVLKQTGDDGLKTLSEKHNAMVGKKQAVLAKRKYALDFGNNRQAMVALEACQQLLIDIFTDLPVNEDKRFSTVNREKYLGERKSLQETQHTFKGSLDRLQAQAAHHEQHLADGQVECPNCHTRFAPGYSEKKLVDIKSTIARGTGKLSEVEGKLKGIDEKIEEVDGYATLYRQFTACVKGYPALNAFWTYLQTEDIPRTAPRMVLSLVGRIQADLRLELEAEEIQSQIEETQKLMHQATLVGNATLAETQEKATDIEVTVSAMTSHLQKLRLMHQEHKTYRADLEAAFKLGERIDKLKTQVTEITAKMVDTMWMETIHHCVRQLQSQLLRKEETLNEMKEQLRRVKDLEEQIETETNRERALTILIDTLSPKDGLIAEGLMGFIRSFVKQVNALIKKVWTYPMVVKECGISDSNGVELDYKFPLMVFGLIPPVPDIGDGSTGQTDMVDLAFITVAMKYLGLSESPLYLDEFAKSFDHEHKKLAMVAIKTLMETTAFTQLFMISHDYQNYSSFSHMEVCVLDPKNIVVPDVYNEHVTMQ